MDARELLRALNSAIPDARVSLRVEDDKLIVGLCDRVGGKFYDAALDEQDYARSPVDVARDVASFYAATKGGS